MYSFGFPSSYHYFGGPSTTLLPLVMSKPKSRSKSRSKQLSKQLSKKLSMNPLLLLLQQQQKKKSPSRSVRKSSASSRSLLKKKRKSSSSLKKKRTPSCTGIHDPYTGKCMKLSMKGPVYEKYIVPFMLGDTSFLSLFSLKDQEKFLMFLQGHHLLARRGGGGHQYHRVRSSGGRRSSTLDEKLNEMARNYMYAEHDLFGFDPDEEEVTGEEMGEKEPEETFYDIFRKKKFEYREQHTNNADEFRQERDQLRKNAQDARHEFDRRSVAQYLLKAANDPDDRTYRETLRRFSMMPPRDVLAILSVADGGEFEGEETGEEY